MPKLRLSFAIGDYDRTRPLIDGTVQIDGVDPVFMTLDPEEIFFRAFRHAEFDVCEQSLSSFTVKTALGQSAYVGIPAFVSRAFRHTSIYVRKGRGIARPEDLKGRRVGVPEYQLTACVWARALLKDDYGVEARDIVWVRGGIEQPGRAEKIALDLPEGIRLEDAPEGRSLSDLLLDGEIDAIVTPRAPSCYDRGDERVEWLFADPTAAATDYYERTGIFPIMHVVGLRNSLAADHPWLPAAILKAFTQAKAVAERRLSDTSATKVTLPFVEEQLHAARQLMGDDYWPYGVDRSRTTLQSFLTHHHQQGLSSRLITVEDLFHPATLEAHKI
ncbi:ABC transporter substrate-binding protein [Aureimonas flava]|uniref:ABC transporter substrate-binding protein n=1 Tax=Aureimonas flava TaxID=2320271 RepID=A0A3A1WGW9_9HYPH|nr:ABC transporter substrate-binding protein [Aureimonas flava]RIX98226.1 ABC transporter substrate-binding protein [Aureimonas flava]